MSSQTITILTPNGRRPTIKVTPDMTILEILEEVCRKYQFSPDEYDLIHHKRFLDLTTMFRFSGLPNNAQLEMVEAKVARMEEEVVLCLQLENGSRVTGNFIPSIYLFDVLMKLSPDSYNDDVVIIYMRKEIFSDSLKNTTLKSLGLTGGRAILRVIHRKVEELKIQAHVSSVLSSKSAEPIEKDVSVQKNHEEPKIETKVDPVTVIAEENSETMDIDPNDIGYTLNGVNSQILEHQIKKPREENIVKVEEEIPEIIEIGPRNAVLFSLDAMKSEGLDFPDSFYELTVDDVRKLLKDLKNQKNSLENAPLLTAKLRELEDNKKVLRQLSEYKTTIIRVQFPNRLVLQGTFSPVDKILNVMEFVKNFLNDSTVSFYLFTTPPKSVLSPDAHLIEVNCVPQALLHFGSDANELNFLKDELMGKLSLPKAAVYAASKYRGLHNFTNESLDTVSEKCCSSTSHPTESLGAIPKRNEDNFLPSSSGTKSTLPKWFKPTGK